MSTDVTKAGLLDELGYAGPMDVYDRALQEAGLSKPEKARISPAKREAVAELFAQLFRRVCSRGDCNTAAARSPDGRTIVLASRQAACEICGGSVNRAAVQRMGAAMARKKLSRLAVVGGSPATRDELAKLAPPGVELRLIDGTVASSLKDATAVVRWAHVVVIWGGTELDHKVSTLFKGPNVVMTPRRGIADVAAAVERFLA